MTYNDAVLRHTTLYNGPLHMGALLDVKKVRLSRNNAGDGPEEFEALQCFTCPLKEDLGYLRFCNISGKRQWYFMSATGEYLLGDEGKKWFRRDIKAEVVRSKVSLSQWADEANRLLNC